MNILLISNSTNAGEHFLHHALPEIENTLRGVRHLVFIPYAAANGDYAGYEKRVQEAFAPLGITVRSIHTSPRPRIVIRHAEAICIGGGNTFALVKMLQEQDLLSAIRRRVEAGIPYVGWSAGANVACPSISTTNDMPIVCPPSFDAIDLVGFQINPHYTDAAIPNFSGETRDKRIEEFTQVNGRRYVVGLREGSMLHLHDDSIELLGGKPLKLFRRGMKPCELTAADDLSFLLARRGRME